MPKFQQRHYVAIAEVLKDHFDFSRYDEGSVDAANLRLLDRFLVFFKEDNPHFDPDRFTEAIWPRN